MPDIDFMWGGDINLSPSGDLGLVDGLQLSVERIIRRLMTRGNQSASINQSSWIGEYIFHPNYGGSVNQRIGGALNVPLLSAMINSQMNKEATVAKNPVPQIILTPFLNGVTVRIVYWLALTGEQKTLSFDVNS